MNITPDKNVYSTYTDKWIRYFKKSDHYHSLTIDIKNDVEFVINTFADYMQSYYGQIPKKWRPSTLKKCCLQEVPQKITAKISVFEHFSPVLLAFFEFLHEGNYIDTERLQDVIFEIGDEIPKVAAKSESWGFAKTALMGAIENDIDPTDIKALNKFITKNAIRKLNEVEEKKELRLKLPEIDRNKKITVQYKDGTIKENVKFKKVEKNLREGKCDLYKKFR